MVGKRIDDRDAANYPLHVLREYALLADGERGALVGPRGDMVWLCAPRWDSDAVFSSLIGGGGLYAVTPADARFVWGGYYEDGTLIWRSRWITETGVIECREALAFPGEADRVVVLRRIIASEGEARVRVRLDARAGFGRHSAEPMDRQREVCGRPAGGQLRLRWTGGEKARPVAADDGGHALAMELTIPAGGCHDLVLELSGQALPERPPEPEKAWQATEHTWRTCVPDFAGRPRPERHPARLRGPARAHQCRRRHGRRGDDEPARARGARPKLRLPLRLDPRPVLHRRGHRRGRRIPAARRRGTVRLRPASGRRAQAQPRLHHRRRPRSRSALARSARLSRRPRHRGQPRQRPVPARRVRRIAAAARGRRWPRPPRRRRVAGRRDRRGRDRGALAPPRGRHLGTGRPALVPEPPDLRRRAARRQPGARRARAAYRRLARAGRGHPGRHRRALHAPVRPLAARARRRPRRRGTAAARDPRRAARPATRVPRPPWRRYAASWPRRAMSTGSGSGPARSATPKARSCSAASSPPWPATSRATRWPQSATSNATAPPAGRRGCTPRSTTSPSASCAATCPRPSCMR